VSYEMMLSAMQVDDDIATERVGAGGVPAEWISAPGANAAAVMLYLHGGGYILSSMRTHRVMLAHLARASGFKVLGLEYRLAPESPFPAPVEDTLAAYRCLLSLCHPLRHYPDRTESGTGVGRQPRQRASARVWWATERTLFGSNNYAECSCSD
jgi:acetyl esterase/lipase